MWKILLLFFLALSAVAQVENTTPLTVVSAASYQLVVAPASLAAIFGTQLSTASEQGRPDAQGKLPAELAGTTVEFNGKPASLLYVSPNQVNCVVPVDADLGPVEVVVRNQNAAILSRGQATVRKVAPGLFSLDGSGEGPGAIFNAVTYASAPFLVATPENPGTDKRTRLAVYATGVRSAESVDAEAKGHSGQVLNLPVDFAGPAPGFDGLDQINVALPPEADGLGTVSLTVTADGVVSNRVTFAVGSLPPEELAVGSLGLSQAVVRSGNDVFGTVSLNGRAASGGVTVSLQTDSPFVNVPTFVTIPEGEVSTRFTVKTSTPGAVQLATITASLNGVAVTAELRINPATGGEFSGLTVTPTVMTGGRQATGTVSLSAPAPIGGFVIEIESNSSIATVPSSVIIPTGQSSATFSVVTKAVMSSRQVTITASSGSASMMVTLTINPPISIQVTPGTITGGNTASGTVSIGDPAPIGGAAVTLELSGFVAQIPAFVTVPQGSTSVTFPIRTLPVLASASVVITACYSGACQSASLTVEPPTPSPPPLSLGGPRAR